MANKFIFYPSLSIGVFKETLMKNLNVPNTDYTSRFFTPEFPEQFRHPYFLVTAGHHFKTSDFRKKLGLEDCLVFGDSGGFQIATEAIKYSPENIEKIFLWLENNSDIASNIDIPPRGKVYNFEESLKISLKNFKFFEDHQTGKTKFLNVLQGANENEYAIWYNKTKDFNFNGWALGGCINNTMMMVFLFAFLLEHGELDKPNSWIHYFGTSRPIDFIMLATMQMLMNQRNNSLIFSCDSSSPGLSAVYGNYFFGINWENLSQKKVYFGNKGKTIYPNLDELIPCPIDCPACKNVTFNGFINDKTIYNSIASHNVSVYKHSSDLIQKIIYSHESSIKEILNSDGFSLYLAIKDIFNSSHPIKTFEKHKPFLNKFSGSKYNESVDNNAHSEFFTF